jgi:hypothetical protein
MFLFVQNNVRIRKYITSLISYQVSAWPVTLITGSLLEFGLKCHFLHIKPCHILIRSRDSVVGIATGYGLDDRGVGVQVPVGVRIFTSPRRPDRLWGPRNLLSNGYRGLLSRGKAVGA